MQFCNVYNGFLSYAFAVLEFFSSSGFWLFGTENINQVSHDHRSFKRNLSNCEQKPEKVRSSTWFEPVTSRYRCDALTNWAMKPLTLGAGHLWVLMSPWRMDVKWYMKCFIYHISYITSQKISMLLFLFLLYDFIAVFHNIFVTGILQ